MMIKYPTSRPQGILTQAILPVVFMALLTTIIYSNTLHCGFIFDDHQYITQDRAIRVTKLNPEKIINAAVNGKPRHRLLPNISFAMNYYFGRYRVEGYHLVNIAIHLLTGICLFFFFRATLGLPSVSGPPIDHLSNAELCNHSTITALFAACLWLAHPVQTQAVTYTVQRMTSMAAMFYILSLLLYALGRKTLERGRHPGKAWAFFAGCFAAGLCAVASKENAASLAAMILVYEWFFFRELKADWFKKQILWIIGIFVFSGIITLVYLGENPVHRILSAYALRDYTLPQRLMTELRVVIYYISLFFFPQPGRLALDYDYPLSDGMLNPPTTLLSFVAIIAMIALSLYIARKKYRLQAFCILWFFIALFIESSVISIEIIYEHRMYLAAMLPALLFSLLLTDFLRPKWIAVSLMCCAIAIFGTWTFQRNFVWKEPVTFWKDNFYKFPNDSRVLNNLGYALMTAGQTDRAIDLFNRSIKLKTASATPRVDMVDPMNNLGIAFIRKKEYDKAIETLQTAIQINPAIALPHINIATAFLKTGQYDRAAAHYKKALKIDPQSTKALNGLGGVCLRQGQTEQAVRYFKQALRLNPENMSAIINLARAFTKTGNLDGAVALYTRALKIDPENDALLVSLGNIYAQKGRLLTAVGLYQKALRLNPKNANAGFSLAVAYATQKDYEKAIRAFEQILSHEPDNPNLYYNIACMNALKNNASEAVAWLEKAVAHGYHRWEHIKSDPDLENIRETEAYREFVKTREKRNRKK